MKLIVKYFKYAVVLPFCIAILAACKNETSGLSAVELAVLCSTPNTVSYKETMDDNGLVFKLSGLNTTITDERIAGKTMYMAKINPTNKLIASQYYVSSAVGMTLNKTNSSRGLTEANYDYSEEYDSLSDSYFAKRVLCRDGIKFKMKEGASDADLLSSRGNNVEEVIYDIGAEREVYFSVSSTDYVKKTAKLYAKTDDVYCWVIEDDKNPWISTTEQGEVTDVLADKYSNKMQEIYKYITEVFGPLPENMIYSKDGSFKDCVKRPMTDFSTTGIKINIIIGDIFSDNTNEMASTDNGVMGMVCQKDLYASEVKGKEPAVDASNLGNYFYLDSYWAVKDEKEAFSTIAHEFQHLIGFGLKYVEYGLEYDSYYLTEMLSMLSEDMMQEYLEVSDNNVSLARLPLFNRYYFLLGLNEFSQDEYMAIAYANAYAFGAWLSRQYGGTKLIQEMALNKYVGIDCMVNAVNTVTGKDYSYLDLLRKYTQALVFINTDYAYPTMNKDAETSITYNGYTYPMKAIDLWHLDDRLEVKSNPNIKYDGPQYFSSSSGYKLPPYGFTLHKVGTVDSDAKSVNLTLSAGVIGNEPVDESAASLLQYYVMFQ
ncbi:MAG: hypothetical protein K6F15_00085 [Treponema sp.]|nr:hypothetical protein [Treponema sp.]